MKHEIGFKGRMLARSEDDGDGRTIEGVAVPFGDVIDVWGERETFDPDTVFEGLDSAKLYYQHDTLIGSITSGENREDGLHITARIADTQQGRDAVALLDEEALDSLSVGFVPIEDRKDKDGVTHRRKVRLLETSLVSWPAYENAKLTNHRNNNQEETPMTEQAEKWTEALAKLTNRQDEQAEILRGIETTQFFASFGWTLLITVGSVALILVCTSMCAWWIVRVNNWAAKLLYTLFLFNMIVPFQMVMFTLSKIADMLKLNTPWGLCIVYLGFGAGLAVFIFTGVIKGIPQELEESAMIDGASVPRIFFQIVVPIMKPSIVSVAILEAMWIWNDYLLPYLTLDLGKYKTISVAVQYLKGGYGSVDMGAMMACLVMAIIPIIIFYLICQKYIVKGVMAGAVKG